MPWANFLCYWLTTRALWEYMGRITGRVPICHLPGQGGLCGGGSNGNRLRDEETRRFSDDGSVLADAISKGDIDVLRRAWPVGRNLVEIPNSLLNWVRNPVDDMELGEKILEDLMAGGLEVVIPHRCS